MFLRFSVVAAPVAKGSTRAFVQGGRAMITSTARNLKGWELLVKEAAARVVPVTTDQAVRLTVEFVLPRPKSHPKRRETLHTKKPDLDKLTRAVLDALIGVVYDDDSQVVALAATKRHAQIAEQPGASIVVVSVPEPGEVTP